MRECVFIWGWRGDWEVVGFRKGGPKRVDEGGEKDGGEGVKGRAEGVGGEERRDEGEGGGGSKTERGGDVAVKVLERDGISGSMISLFRFCCCVFRFRSL